MLQMSHLNGFNARPNAKPKKFSLAVGNANVSPYLSIYNRTGDVSSKLADPATLPTANVYGVAFSADGAYLAAVNNYGAHSGDCAHRFHGKARTYSRRKRAPVPEEDAHLSGVRRRLLCRSYRRLNDWMFGVKSPF